MFYTCLALGEYLKSEGFQVYAIIQTGGKQYRVHKGDIIYIEKLDLDNGADVKFDVMLLGKDDAGAVVGAPTVEGASVDGKVISQVKGRKITVYKYKAKKNERKKQGHRQPYTKVEITAING